MFIRNPRKNPLRKNAREKMHGSKIHYIQMAQITKSTIYKWHESQNPLYTYGTNHKTHESKNAWYKMALFVQNPRI